MLSEGNPKAFVAVLSHIIPAPGCRFYVDFRRTEGFQFTAEEITDIYALVFQYFENYLKIQPLSHFSIYFNTDGRGIFKIEAGTVDSKFLFSVDLAQPPLFVTSFFSNKNLRHFLSLLENEEVLTITRHMLPVFLRLRFVEFHHLFAFLEWRWEIGLVLDSVHLPMPATRVDVQYNLSRLVRFTGLQVEWENGAGRYVCGSGNPDQLIFPMSIYL